MNKTENGKNYLMAMYSERPLIKDASINNGFGFISSVTNQKAFYLRKFSKVEPRITMYNEHFFIYGCDEIKFQTIGNELKSALENQFRSFDIKYKDL